MGAVRSGRGRSTAGGWLGTCRRRSVPGAPWTHTGCPDVHGFLTGVPQGEASVRRQDGGDEPRGRPPRPAPGSLGVDELPDRGDLPAQLVVDGDLTGDLV